MQWGFPIANTLSLNKPILIGSKRKNKKKAQGQHQRIYIRRSIRKGGLEGSKQKWWRIETQASEAKGPFPGGKRVGSWGKKKKKTHPTQWVGLKA